MSDLYVAQGHRTSLMTGKEATYGVKPTLGYTTNFETFGLKISDAPVSLDGSRGDIATAYPATGGRSISGSATMESTADVIPWWIAMGMGAQTTPSTTIVNTTTSASALINATSITVVSSLNIFPGMKLTVGTSTPATVATVSGTTVTFTAGLSAATSSGATVTCTATGAYLSKFTLGTPLPSFSAELTELNGSGGTFASDNFLGCMVESLAFQLAKGQIRVNPNIIARDFAPQNSPSTPAYSTKFPFIFDQQFAPVQWNATVIGTGTESSVIGVNATLANNLQKDLFSLGNGNLSRKPQESRRGVSGSLSLDFASTTVRDAFQAARTGGQKTAVSLTLPICGTDVIDVTNGVPYAMTIVLPKIYLSNWDAGWKGNGPLQQSASFTAHPSGIGANDPITVYYIGSLSSAY